MNKINLLVINNDHSGVDYYRSLTPVMQIQKINPDNLNVEYLKDISTIENPFEYLSKFDIIHYHKFIFEDFNTMISLKRELTKTLLVLDLDDYWFLNKEHPQYYAAIQRKLHEVVMSNIRLADYITTTNDYLANKIKEVSKKDNVYVFENAVNPEFMSQFKDNRVEDENGLVRINYMAGSSHKPDVALLNGVINRLESDTETKGKTKRCHR